MSGSLNQMPKYRANLPKEGHNIGMKYYFTSAPGMILPVYHHILNQGEKIAFNASVNTNVAIPLIKPAQLKVHQKMDVFFIPMQMMLTSFGQSFYGGNDFVTSLLSGNDLNNISAFPVLEFENKCSSLFNSVYNINRRAYIDNNDSSVSPNYNTLGFDCIGKSAYRLLMHLGYNPQCVFADFDGQVDGTRTITFNDLRSYQPNVFPAALLAYHAIYENYYRNDDREKRRIKTYQFDYMFEDSDISAVPDSIFQLHYHSRIKDYFTSLKVSPILSTLNLSGDFRDSGNEHVLESVLNFLDNSNINVSDPSRIPVDDFSNEFKNKQITQFYSYVNPSQRLSTGAIRSLFAVEKLNRILGRAKKDYDSQTLAHLGYKVPRDVKHEITYLGGYDGGIGVQQRYSQANTYNNTTGDGAELGEQFGTAEGGISGDHVINFEAPCHGVFMAVMYTVPETSYPQGVCVDKLNNITNRLDLYQPEFDKMGMQPLFAYEAVNRKVGNLNESDYYVVPENIILGWQYRYEQFKRKYDRHSIAFFRPRNVSSEVNTWSPWIVGSEPFDYFDCTFPTATPKLASDALPSSYAFFVSPTYLDNLFVNSYNTHIGLVSDSDTTPTYTDDEKNSIYDYIEHPWLLFQTDMFMHAATFNVKLISTMSKYGEPELL